MKIKASLRKKLVILTNINKKAGNIDKLIILPLFNLQTDLNFETYLL